MEPDNFTDLLDQYFAMKLIKNTEDWELQLARDDLNKAISFIRNEATLATSVLAKIKEAILL